MEDGKERRVSKLEQRIKVEDGEERSKVEDGEQRTKMEVVVHGVQVHGVQEHVSPRTIQDSMTFP